MSYQPPSFDEIRADLLDEYRNLVTGADVSVRSEIYARVSVAAGASALVCEGLRYVEAQIWPDSADSGNLRRHAAIYDITPKEATAAAESAAIQLTGTNGTVVASGLTLTAEDGTAYTTTSGGTIASGVLVVGVEADEAGVAGNKFEGEVFTLDAPPSGVDGEATAILDISGGTDNETDAALAMRVINRMRFGAAGGTANDYEQWALTVDGVVEAHILPLRRGAGTVTVAVFSLDGDERRTPANSSIRTAVATHIEGLRPVTAEVDVPDVDEFEADVIVRITELEDGYDEDTVKEAVSEAIIDHIYGLETGGPMYRSKLGAAISRVGGVLDFTLIWPDVEAGNITPTLSEDTAEILVPGTITVYGPDDEVEVP